MLIYLRYVRNLKKSERHQSLMYQKMCMCSNYKCVIMALILSAFGVLCFICDSGNNDSTEFNEIITLWDVVVK